MTEKKRIATWIIVLGTVCLAIFMRFYHLPELFYFMHDEETVAFRILRLVLHGELFLIGGVTPFHVHLTPYFYFLSALILWLGKLNPLAWGIFGGLLGMATVILIFFVGKKTINTQTGVLASLLYSGSYLTSLFDRHYWPLSLDPILAVIVYYALFQLVYKKSRYFYWLIGVLIIGISADLSTLLFVVVAAISWIIFRFRLGKLEKTTGIGFFVLSFVPLVIFDIRHNFSNIGEVSLFFSERAEKLGWSFDRFSSTLLFIPRTLLRLFHVFGNQEVARQYTYCPLPSVERLESVPWWGIIIFIIFIALVIQRLYKAKAQRERVALTILTVFLGSAFFGINLYGNIFASMVHDHYLATIFPVFFLLSGYLGSILWKKNIFGRVLTIIFMGIFLVINIRSLVNSTNDAGYVNKMEAVKFATRELYGKDFSLDSLGTCYKYGGWRYLFFIAGHEPSKSYVDQNYFWLYEKLPAQEHPRYLAVMVSRGKNESPEFLREYNRYLPGTIKRKTFGTIEVLIVDNDSHQYDGLF